MTLNLIFLKVYEMIQNWLKSEPANDFIFKSENPSY